MLEIGKKHSPFVQQLSPDKKYESKEIEQILKTIIQENILR